MFLGVSDFFAGGGAIKGTESAKLKLNPKETNLGWLRKKNKQPIPEPIKSFNDVNCLVRNIVKFSAVFDTRRWPV